jgi:hypothetical protein
MNRVTAAAGAALLLTATILAPVGAASPKPDISLDRFCVASDGQGHVYYSWWNQAIEFSVTPYVIVLTFVGPRPETHQVPIASSTTTAAGEAFQAVGPAPTDAGWNHWGRVAAEATSGLQGSDRGLRQPRDGWPSCT